jgi:hypothetical protein
MVGSGGIVLMRKFGSMVEISVGVGARGVKVGRAELIVVEAKEAVGVHGIGRKGVGDGVGFAADVTIANGRFCWADALLPQAVSRSAATMATGRMDLIGKAWRMALSYWLEQAMKSQRTLRSAWKNRACA